MKPEKKKKSLFKLLLSKQFLLLIQLFASICLCFLLYRLDILPHLYLGGIGLILLILLIISIIFQTSGQRRLKKKNKIGSFFLSKIFTIVLSGFLLYASVMVYRGDNFVSNITNANYQTRLIAIYTLKANKIEKLDDLKGNNLGYTLDKSEKKINEVLNEVSDKVNYDKQSYDNYSDLADALYNGKVDAILVDQSYIAILEEEHLAFLDETKLIYKKEYKETLSLNKISTNVTKKPFILYLTGIDTYGSVETVSRSDVNLLVCVNPKEHQILLVSVPRDTKVNLHMNGKMDKLTHSAMYGINETISTIEDFLGLKINYYAKTNFSGITNIIDALGGVNVDSPYAFKTMHGGYTITKGNNQLDGDKALCFVRERYALPHGDFDRGRNQQLLLKAMIKKATSPSVIANYSEVLSAVEGSFTTNMDSKDLKSLVNMQLNERKSWEIFNVQVSGEPSVSYKTYSQPGKKTSINEPDKTILEKIRKIIDKIESGKKLDSDEVKKLG